MQAIAISQRGVQPQCFHHYLMNILFFVIGRQGIRAVNLPVVAIFTQQLCARIGHPQGAYHVAG